MDFLHRQELRALRPGRSLTDPSAIEDGRESPAVLLVGHGSHRSPDSARPIHTLARRLRERAWFPEVRVAFWKEEPQLHYAFDLIERRRVFVVPVFTSEGYFTDRVLPREMGLGEHGSAGMQCQVESGHHATYCAPVGSHPRMADVVLERAREARDLAEPERQNATLVVIGHGTDRHPRSGQTTYALVEHLRNRSEYGDVVPAFLDQEPRLAGVLDRVSGGDAIAVPFFISDGWHAGTTIPRDLADSSGASTGTRRRLWYAQAAGTHPAMVEVVRDLVREQSTGEKTASAPGEGAASSAAEPDLATPAVEARRAFTAWIETIDGAPRIYQQTVIRRAPGDRFEIRHVQDLEASADDLERFQEAEAALEVAVRTGDGSHRPLRTEPNLRRGWSIDGLTASEVWEAYAHLYPALPVHQSRAARGSLRTEGYRRVARRQTGMYAGVEALTQAQLARVVQDRCGPSGCLRQPSWHGDAGTSRPEDHHSPGGGAHDAAADGFAGPAPCPRPCSLLIARARKALDRAAGSD